MIANRFLSSLALAGVALLASEVSAQGTWEELWVHASVDNDNWRPTSDFAALGYYGTQSLYQAGPFTEYTRLLSSFDTGNSTPVWQRTDPFETQHHRVAAAETESVFATLHSRSTDDPFNLRDVVTRVYSATSSAPTIEFVSPVMTNGHESVFVGVARDGSRVVTAVWDIFGPQSGLDDTVVQVVNPATGGVFTFRVQLGFGGFTYAKLSADGRRLLVGTTNKFVVCNTVNGQTLHSGTMPFGFQPAGADLSFNGSTMILFGSQVVGPDLTASVRVYVAGPGTNQIYQFDQEISDLDSTRCPQAALSDDGLRLVQGLDYASFNRVLTRGFRIDPFTRARSTTFQRNTFAGSSFQYYCSAVALDPTGQLAVFGMAGDGGGSAPELLVFDTNSNLPLETVNLAGSVHDVDLVNGFCLVANKTAHFSEFVSGGELHLFTRPRDLMFRGGKPRPNATLEVETTGAPAGSFSRVLRSPYLGLQPWEVGQLGLLYPERTALSSSPVGDADLQGTAEGTWSPSPVVGMVRYAQALHTGPLRRLGDDWLPVMTLP